MNCHESIHKLWDHLMQADLNSGLFADGGTNLPLKKPEVRPQGTLWPVYQLAVTFDGSLLTAKLPTMHDSRLSQMLTRTLLSYSKPTPSQR